MRSKSYEEKRPFYWFPESVRENHQFQVTRNPDLSRLRVEYLCDHPSRRPGPYLFRGIWERRRLTLRVVSPNRLRVRSDPGAYTRFPRGGPSQHTRPSPLGTDVSPRRTTRPSTKGLLGFSVLDRRKDKDRPRSSDLSP